MYSARQVGPGLSSSLRFYSRTCLTSLTFRDTSLPGTSRNPVQISKASQLYLGGMDLVAIQETLGHAWVATTMNYIHVHATHVEDAWLAGQQRAADRLKGLLP